MLKDASQATPKLNDALTQAQASIQAWFADQGHDAQALFQIFNGQQAAPSTDWLAAANTLRQDIAAGRYSVKVELRSNTELQGALGAFAAHGADGTPIIYMNKDWLGAWAETPEIARVLVEEFGHSLDASLNAGRDTAGDEGQLFSAVVSGAQFDATTFALDNDQHSLQIDGATVQVEEASYKIGRAHV